MDGDWNTVKAKPKAKKKTEEGGAKPKTYGGKGAGGKLVCGPVKNGQMAASSGK